MCGRAILSSEAVLRGGDVLPAFAVRVRDIFAVLGNEGFAGGYDDGAAT
jgi:hypothetical protein